MSTVLERVHPATGATALHHACLSVIDGGGASAARAVAPSAALAAVAALLEAGAAADASVGSESIGSPSPRRAGSVPTCTEHETVLLGPADAATMLPVGATPLLLAARGNAYRLAGVLLEARATGPEVAVDAAWPTTGEADDAGATALHFAARWGNVALVNALLAAGANPAACDARGWTPLHAAASRGRTDVCRALLDEGGPSPAVPVGDGGGGPSALDLAAEGGHDATAAALREALASTRNPA